MGHVNFRLHTSSWLVFNCLSLPHHVSPLTLKRKRSSPHFCLASMSGTSAPAGSAHTYQILGPPVFSRNPQLTQSFTHDRPGQLLSQPKSLRGQLPVPIDYVYFSFLLFFFSLSFIRKLPFLFFITYHFTLQLYIPYIYQMLLKIFQKITLRLISSRVSFGLLASCVLVLHGALELNRKNLQNCKQDDEQWQLFSRVTTYWYFIYKIIQVRKKTK